MKTGEFGFCAQCGGTIEVRVLPQDRAQRRAVAALARQGCWTEGQILERIGWKDLNQVQAYTQLCDLIDLQLGLFYLAEALAYILGEPVDLISLALEQAEVGDGRDNRG